MDYLFILFTVVLVVGALTLYAGQFGGCCDPVAPGHRSLRYSSTPVLPPTP